MIGWQRFRHQTRAGLEDLSGFLRYLVHRFLTDDCLNASATLAYTTLLALVPLFAVSLSVLTAFPVFENFNDQVQDFLFENLVPASTEVVQRYLQDFAQRAAGLTAAGLIGMVFTALLMVGAIDKALNRIFRVSRPRRPLQSFMVYWTVLTIAPFLVAFSLLLPSYVEGLSEFAGVEPSSGMREVVLEAAPFMAILAAFTFLYCAVPNRRIPVLHALAGGAFAAILFELAKRAFALFVTSFPSYEAVYGALATLPIFLLWIYLSWVVVLLGAEFTQTIGAFRQGREGSLSDPRQSLLLAVRITGDFWCAQRAGRTLGMEELLQLEPDAGDLAVQVALNDLQRARVIRGTDNGQWMLARDPSTFTLLELYRGAPFVLSDVPDNLREKDAWNRAVGDLLRSAMSGVEQALALPLKSVFSIDREALGKGARPLQPVISNAEEMQQSQREDMR